MKARFLFISLILSCSIAFAQNNYSSLWTKVAGYENESLPISALNQVNEIYSLAKADNNSPEVIKALIHQLKYSSVIDNDAIPGKIEDIRLLAEGSKDRVEQSVLYYMLAQLHYQYYSQDMRAINQRTAIEGSVPEDIREWSGNLFIRKITDYVLLSVEPARDLINTASQDYGAIMLEGTSSRDLRPTMYDFLMNEGISLLSSLSSQYYIRNYFPQTSFTDEQYFAPVKKFVKLDIKSEGYDLPLVILSLYQDLLDYRLNVPVVFYAPADPNSGVKSGPVDRSRQALLMVDLDRMDFVKGKFQSDKTSKLYTDALESLSKEYSRHDYCVEILYKLAVFYSEMRYSMPDDKEGAKKAYDICIQGIDQYPNYERINLLNALLHEITLSNLILVSDKSVYPEKELELKMHYKNYNQLVVEIYRINAPITAYDDQDDRKGLFEEHGELIHTQQVDLNNEFPYLSYDTIVKIPMKEFGCYEYVVRTDQEEVDEDDEESFINRQFSVSRLASLSRIVDGKREILVTDRITGKPVKGAVIELYEELDEYKLLGSSKSDKLGLAPAMLNLKDDDDNDDDDVDYYRIYHQADSALMLSNTPYMYGHYDRSNNNKRTSLSILTDRSIYRPGQTIQFKGIVYTVGQKTSVAVPKEKIELTFLDPNNKEISKEVFITNEFGSFSGEFTIPYGLLNGNFRIESDKYSSSTWINVEEYKRPTFDITFSPIEKTYSFGDEVTVKGNAKSFAGVNIQGEEVKYTIRKQPHWFFRKWFNPEQIAEGTVKTNDDGSFEIRFTPEKAFEDKDISRVYYTYMIEAELTNLSGETQSSNTSVSIGDTSMILSFSDINESNESLDGLKVSATNLNGVALSAEGTYEIYRLTSDGTIKERVSEVEWEQGDLLFGSSFSTKDGLQGLPKKAPESGCYRIIAKAKDDKGREVESQSDFTIASAADKRPPVPVYQWVMTPKTTVAVGEKAEIVYGSTAKDVYVLYELFQGNKRISASRFVLNNQNKKLEIPFLESYGDGIIASFTFVKDNQFFTKSVNIYRKMEDKSLTLTMETFRDRLLPGQEEEWKVSVKNADGTPVAAELLASMYDASLDKIRFHYWNFYPRRNIYLGSIPYFRQGNEFDKEYEYKDADEVRYVIPSFNFSTFNWFGLDMGGGMLNSMRYLSKSLEGRAFGLTSSDMPVLREVAGYSPKSAVDIADLEDHKVVLATNELADENYGGAGNAEPVQVRENFNETAFFYPQLRTDANGEVTIRFTVPESNTTWRFMGLAHTQDLLFGQIQKEAISQKKLMVAPNMPRFMREGDRLALTTNVSNLSDETLAGTVSIECFDPNTNRTTIVVPDASKAFSVEAGRTVAVSWSFDIPSGIDLTAVKIVAKTPVYSDGEQHLIPVLPNRILVTESMPMNVRGGETKTFTLDKLAKNTSSSLENYRLTLEFTSNPIWYAVQALPAMQEPQSDNVLAWFAAYYSNTLATSIANTTPRLKNMIETWTKQGGTKETLLSNLEKNQELKAILLEETPWAMEATDETEQKNRLALLFDINRNTNLNQTAIDKIRGLQAGDGGWTWYKNMPSSVSITQYILYGLGNLPQSNDADILDMQAKAIAFIDREIKRNYDQYKKINPDWKKKSTLSTQELEYLYVRSLYPDTSRGNAQEASDFYTSIVERYWAKEKSLYRRALMATLLSRSGNEKNAQSIVKSLREHATRKNELGMFWANNNTSAFMFQSATAVHTFIMEAFAQSGASDKEMDEMKLWLLKQRQTQEWESTPATVNAVNILLKTGNNWLESTENAEITLGGQPIDSSTADAGTGYIKEVINGQAITPAMANVRVNQIGQSPAWGALYWQYYETIDKVTAAKTELNVEKSLFIEQNTPSGKKIVPASNIKVGDKIIVRLTVRCDRDMEYVMLKDMRAACFEPSEQLSGTRWREKVVYYQSTKDASTNFYFYNLPKGTYVFEYPVYASREGDYSGGICTIQCMYAPEYVSHTNGERVNVKESK